MTTELRLRRGSTAQHATFTGAAGEITVDTDLDKIRVHDGVTPGGHLAGDTSADILAAATKGTIVDADHLAISDSEAGGVFKRFSWANVKATLKTYFDTLYLAFTQAGTGAVERTYLQRFGEMLSLTEFGGLGNGVYDNATSIVNACASGAPVYVPKGASFYATTTLSEANRALLWGPGVIKVAGVEAFIAPYPSTSSNTSPASYLRRRALAPTNNVTNGSVGLGVMSTNVRRTGGYGQYGNHLKQYQIDTALPGGQFDVNDTSWLTVTNLSGGTGFSRWAGVNTPAVNRGQTYSSGAVVGDEVNVGNRWGNFGLKLDLGSGRWTVAQQLVPDVLPAEDGVNTITCTMSAGTPGLVNISSHGYTANMGVVFNSAGGTLPAELTAGVAYYVSATGLTTNAFAVSSTIGGTAIAFAAPSSGSVTALPSYPGSFAQAYSRSVWGHQWWVGRITRSDTICAGGIGTLDYGGASSAGAPAAWQQVRGYWVKGIDFTNATFTGTIALQLVAGQAIYFGAASMSGAGTGHLSFSTGGTGNVATFYADNYSSVAFKYGSVGSAAAISFFGGALSAKITGYGTPTNGAKLASFDANTITHADLAKVVAQMILDHKQYGYFGT